MRAAFVITQALTFVALAALLAAEGEYRLAVAQILLGAVTALVYF